jgi:hypothetical protein
VLGPGPIRFLHDRARAYQAAAKDEQVRAAFAGGVELAAGKAPTGHVAPGRRRVQADGDAIGQNVTEHNPAPSPSGHPLLSYLIYLIRSGPPTIHQIFT